MKRYKKKLTIKNNKKRNTYKRRTMRQKKLSGGNDILNSFMPSPPKHKPSNRLRSIKGVKPSRDEINKAVNKAVADARSNEVDKDFIRATIAANLPDIKYVSPHKKNNKTQKNTNIRNDLEKKLRDLRNNQNNRK